MLPCNRYNFVCILRHNAGYMGEEDYPHLDKAFFQGVVERNKVLPQPPFLQVKQSQLPQSQEALNLIFW